MDSLPDQTTEEDKCDLLSAAAALYISSEDAVAILRSEALLTLHSKRPRSGSSLLSGAVVAISDTETWLPWLATVQGVDMEQPREGSTVDSLVHGGLVLRLQDGSSTTLGSDISNRPQLSSFSDVDLGRMAAKLNWQAFVGEHVPMSRYVGAVGGLQLHS